MFGKLSIKKRQIVKIDNLCTGHVLIEQRDIVPLFILEAVRSTETFLGKN